MGTGFNVAVWGVFILPLAAAVGHMAYKVSKGYQIEFAPARGDAQVEVRERELP